jgi:Lrp/AsnC family transcriptional regulator for asnA, asnC and gidA
VAAGDAHNGPAWGSRGTLVRHGEFVPFEEDGQLSEIDRGLIRALQVDGRRSYAQLARELDRLDREINRDGRVPFAHVAERLDISEAQVRKRYARLIESGVVRVMALTKPSSLGFATMARVAVEAAPGAKVNDLADRLTALTSIAYLAVCTGRFEILAEVVCRDPGGLLELLDREVRSLPGVARVEAMLCLDLYYRPVTPAP